MSFFSRFLVVFLVAGFASLGVAFAQTANEKQIGQSCTYGASSADFDTLAQCTSTTSSAGTMQKAPIFVGAVTAPPYANTTCDSGKAGMIQYTASTMQYCNGTAWSTFSSPSGTNAQSMFTGWPDAIVCNVTNPTGHGIRIFWAKNMPNSSTSLYQYYAPDLYVNFNSGGTFNSYTYVTTANCNKSIAQLIADGQAFNLANGQAGGTAEMQDGTAGAPGLYFSADPNTGFYRPAADTVAIATAGVERFRINAAGNIGLGASDPTTGSNLDLSSKTDSVLLPKGTDVQRPTGVAGMIRYNTTSNSFEVYQGSTPAWVAMGTGSGTSTLGASTATASPYRSGEANTGLFSRATGEVNITSLGTEVVRVAANGAVTLGSSAATAGTILDLAAGTGTAKSSMIVPKDTTANRPTTGVAGMVRYNTTLNVFEGYNGTLWTPLGSGAPLAVRVFTSTATYTPTTGATYAIVEVVGGGGGGGGGSDAASGGSGGSAGGYAKKLVSLSSVSSVLVTVGNGGTAGAAAGDGGAGGTSSFGAYVSASGGGAGRYNNAANAAGGGSSGDVNLGGGTGHPSAQNSWMVGGNGGASFFGGGGAGGGSNSNNGAASPVRGAGGGGARMAAGATGGAGGAGLVIVTEYSGGTASGISGGGGGTSELGASAAAASPYRTGETNTGLFSPASGTVSVSSLGTEVVRVGSNGAVTLGSSAATSGAILDLAAGTGTAKSSMIVPKDTSANRPTTGVVGMIRYNTTTNSFEGYQGSSPAWSSLGGGSGTNAQSLKSGWPDVIVCSDGSTVLNLIASAMPWAAGSYWYQWTGANGVTYGAAYTAAGAYSTHNSLTAFDCVTNAWSIAQLISNGKAFNIANGGGGASEMQDGTAGAPGLYFSADPNTGLYRPAADTVAIATAGVERIRVDASGNISIGAAAATAGAALDLAAATGTARSSIILPKDTTANRPTTGVEGMMRYNTTTKTVEAYQGATPAWISMSNMPIPSGVILTGNVYGLNISKTAANQLTITKGVAMDSTNRLVLTLAADDTLTIPSAASTIYHVFVVRLVADGSIDTRVYTTESGVESDVQVDAWRWIGFVRTNASSNICDFIMNGDLVEFVKRSENLLATLPIITHTSMSHSSLVPVTRISEISYGFRASDTTTLYIRNSANTATRASYGNILGTSSSDTVHTWHRDGYSPGVGMLSFQDPAYGVVADYGGNVYIHMVRIKR